MSKSRGASGENNRRPTIGKELILETAVLATRTTFVLVAGKLMEFLPSRRRKKARGWRERNGGWLTRRGQPLFPMKDNPSINLPRKTFDLTRC